MKDTAGAVESMRKSEILGLKPEMLHPVELASYRQVKSALNLK